MKSFAVIVVDAVVDVAVDDVVAAFAVAVALGFDSEFPTVIAEFAICAELAPACKIPLIVLPFLSALP
jgi:hypothetical protein